MVEKIFWRDPYLTELTTTVTSVTKNQITLKETIFYAFSGGQESDKGTIGGVEVLIAEKNGKEIFYTLSDNHELKIGDTVIVQIDWSRRYKLMKLHFAAEVVLETVCKNFPDVVKIGAHMSEDKARIDFLWDQKISPYLKMIEESVAKIIESNQPIISEYSDKENERRYWKINEFAQVHCGGTHIKRTGEIGKIRLKRENPGKGKERIEIYLVESAL